MSAILGSFGELDKLAPEPLYLQIKQIIERCIHNGEWCAGQKLPSENELVGALDVSRMTVNRAFRELTQQGLINRVHGRGSYVAERPRHASLIELQDIALEVAESGKRHSAEVISLLQGPADVSWLKSCRSSPIATCSSCESCIFRMTSPSSSSLAMSIPVLVPDFMQQDFNRITSTAYLLQQFRPDEMEHIVRAVIADKTTRELLQISREQPCLELSRRTWVQQQVVTQVTLTYPGNRYDLGARYATRDYQSRP